MCPTKIQTITRYVRQMCQTKSKNKMQDMSDRARCVDTVTTSKPFSADMSNHDHFWHYFTHYILCSSIYFHVKYRIYVAGVSNGCLMGHTLPYSALANSGEINVYGRFPLECRYSLDRQGLAMCSPVPTFPRNYIPVGLPMFPCRSYL